MSAVVVHNAIASLVQAYAEIVGEQDAHIKELQAQLLRERMAAETNVANIHKENRVLIEEQSKLIGQVAALKEALEILEKQEVRR